MIFFKKREAPDNGYEKFNIDVKGMIQTIEEFSDEQREILDQFQKKMEIFSSERSLDSCIDALNLSLQLANVREKLLETYKRYNFLLETEIKKMLKYQQSKQ